MELQTLLEIENTPEILAFTCPNTDYLLWPFIRTTVLRMIVDRELYGSETLIKATTDRLTDYFQMLWCLADGTIHNLRFINHHAKILFFSSGITNVNIDGKYLNRVSDYFALCYPDSTLLIERPHRWQHLRPRVNRNVAYHLPLRVIAAGLERLPVKKTDNKTFLACIAYVDSRLKATLGIEFTASQRRLLQTKLTRYCAGLALQLCMYRSVYRRLNPDLIFFEDGHYGGMGHLIRLAKELGIKTAEMQHGMISAGHDAYNFAPAVLNSEIYRLYVPDYFLAYGQWWADHIQTPAQVINIGNPYYDTMRRKWKDKIIPQRKILLLSNGVKFDSYMEMAIKLNQMLSGQFEIIVRPHPRERNTALQTYGHLCEEILIDDSDDLYSRLAESYAVIGEISTALFEAIGFAKKIFSLSTPIAVFGLPDNPFEPVETVEQLVEKLLTNESGRPRLDEASIWADNWEIRYRNFITQQLGNLEPGHRGVS